MNRRFGTIRPVQNKESGGRNNRYDCWVCYDFGSEIELLTGRLTTLEMSKVLLTVNLPVNFRADMTAY